MRAEPHEENWRLFAACRDHDPELWFPAKKTDPRREQAQRICRDCPVRTQCAEFATQTDSAYGIWGGQTATERGVSKFKRIEPDKPTPRDRYEQRFARSLARQRKANA